MAQKSKYRRSHSNSARVISALVLIPLLLCFVVVMSGFFGYPLYSAGAPAQLPLAVDFDIDGDLQQYVTDFFTENEAAEMIPIIGCESEFRHFDEDGSVLMNRQGSSATGIAQILASAHPDPNVIKRYNRRYHTNVAVENFDITTFAGNIGYALILYKIRGTKDWECAKLI